MSVLTASQDGFNKVTKEVFEFRHAATDLTLALFVCCFRVANSPKQSRYPQFPMNFPRMDDTTMNNRDVSNLRKYI